MANRWKLSNFPIDRFFPNLSGATHNSQEKHSVWRNLNLQQYVGETVREMVWRRVKVWFVGDRCAVPPKSVQSPPVSPVRYAKFLSIRYFIDINIFWRRVKVWFVPLPVPPKSVQSPPGFLFSREKGRVEYFVGRLRTRVRKYTQADSTSAVFFGGKRVYFFCREVPST